MTPVPQTLEDLRQSQDAAWLWDVARARLVWANPPAIAAFDATSVFDLIDRPFAADEPALATLAELQKKLARGVSETVELAFPSLGEERQFTCQCSLHALADGRDGILAISPAPRAPSLLAEAGLFEDLPVATFALREDGTMSFANELARATFDHRTITTLAELLATPEEAASLLHRLAQTRLVSAVCAYLSPFGPREARLTLRRPMQGGTIFALAVMEDVTERRSLERAFAAAPPALPEKLAPAEQLAFEKLGQTLQQAAAMSAPPEKKPEPAPVKPPPAPAAAPVARVEATPPVPKALTEAFERHPDAMAVIQNRKPVYVNAKLVHLLGHRSVSALLQDAELWATLTKTPIGATSMGLPTAAGGLLELNLVRHAIPWLNGKAEQFLFEPRPSPPKKNPPEPVTQAASPPPHPRVEAAPAPAPAAVTPVNRPASEDELRSILDISSDGIITLDDGGLIQNFSAGAEAIFGLRSAEVLNKPFVSLLTTEGATVVEEYLAGLEGKGLASVFNDGREVMGSVRQGGNVPLFLNIGRLQARHSPATFCVVLRDITSWKRTERELREAKEVAEEASRHKSEFLARVSHELRTPLNAILGFSEIMRLGQYGELRNEKYRGYVTDIHNSGSHLLSMIDDLLDLSRIEAGGMELNFTSVSLSDCFDHAARMLQEQATRARVLMRKSFPENLPRIVADQKSIRQVMSNLLSNAIKYTDPGGQVIVSAQVTGTGALTLRLKDTGIGMNAQELKQALLPFTRVEVPGRVRQGTGLGLPLTKALVEANRAQFAISSEPGQGTLVEVTFPTTRVLAE